MKLDLLAIGVHPDDVELSCSGTLLHHIALGKKVGLLDLSKGELGTRGSAYIRTQEAMKSMKKMGALVREQLDLQDGFFTHNEESLRAIIHIIRKYQPELVLCNALEDRHPDHARSAKLVSDACFYTGLAKIETIDNTGESQKPWRPKAVYHYIQDRYSKPDFVINITTYIDQKLELILTYKTQFYDPHSTDPVTPISGQDFLESVKGKDSVMGRAISVSFAEGFNVDRTPGVKNLFDLY